MNAEYKNWCTIDVAFVNFREESKQQATYRGLLSLWLRKIHQTVFVNTNHITDRVRKLKPKELLRQKDPESDDILQRNDQIKYSDGSNKTYWKCTLAAINDLCLAQFLSFYASSSEQS